MNFKLTEKKINDIEADLEVIVVVGGDLEHRFVKDRELLEKSGFKGDQEEVCYLPERDRVYVGVESIGGENMRSAIGVLARRIRTLKYKNLKIASYMNHPKCTAVLRGMVEGFILGFYSFEKYKSQKSKSHLKEIIILLEDYREFELNLESCESALEKSKIIAEAVNFTRDIVNTPPDDFYPKVMASVAKDIAEDGDLECRILKPKEIKKESMNALLAVSRASVHKPRVIHLSYKPKNPKAIISLVGKGLTYDSGGLSLKPSDFMVTMKLDKSGASAVLGVMKGIS